MSAVYLVVYCRLEYMMIIQITQSYLILFEVGSNVQEDGVGVQDTSFEDVKVLIDRLKSFLDCSILF